MPAPKSASSGCVLVVDDDEIFREVTASVLEDKGYEVLQAGDGLQALEVLRHNDQKIGVVLSDIRMPEMDGVQLLKNIRALGKLPVILATGFSEVMETQAAHDLGANGFLAKPFETQELLSTIRGILEDRGDQASLKDEDFARIMIDDFVSGKVLKHNIFIRLAKDKFIKIAHEGLDLDIERVRSYKSRGVKYLYLLKKDFREYLSTTLSMSKKVASSPIDPEKKQRFLRHTGNLIAEKIQADGLDPFAVEAASTFFESSLSVIVDEDELFRALSILNEHSDHQYAHSVGTSLYSIMIARAIGWHSAPTLFRVGLAGLLHDIGMKEIDKRILDTPRPELDPKDRAIYETHPTRSAEILSACEGIPEEVIQAVVQHHEDPNGFGYPHGIKGQISPMARLLAVADSFCEFAIKNPDYPKGMSAAMAIDKMAQFRSQSLDLTYFKALRNLFGKG